MRLRIRTSPRALRGLFVAALVTASMVQPMPAGASDAGLSARLRAESSDYERTVSEGTLLGAAAGALVGGAIGAAQGDARAALGGAAIGALAGGILGNLGGHAVAGTKSDYARREDGLDAAIRRARSGNAKLASLTSTAGRLVQARRAELARVERGGDDGARRRLASDLATEVSTLDESLATARQTRDTLRANAANFSGRGGSQMAGEAERADGQIARLQARRDELARMREGL